MPSSNSATLRPREAISTARRPYFGAKSVGSFVPALTAKAFRKFGFSASALIVDWHVIVGREFAEVTAPERLSWPRAANESDDATGVRSGRAGATLVLRVDGSKALEVQYAARQLIERINTHFGYAAVAQLRIIQVPRVAPPPLASPRRPLAPIAGDVTGVGDSRLRDALARLAGQVNAGR
jgi:hypothetical protein